MKKIKYLLIGIILINLNINVYAAPVNFCNQETVKAFIFIGNIIQIAKILVPLIIIVMGMVDFGRAVFSDDERAISKCVVSLLKRIVAGIVIFFIPTIVYAIIDVLEPSEMNNYNNKFTCSKCVLKVKECNKAFINKLPKQ